MIRKYPQIFSILFTVLITGALYYIMLPPINLHSVLFWFFISLIIIIYFMINSLLMADISIQKILVGGSSNIIGKRYKILFIIPIIVVSTFLINFLCSAIFNSESYYNRIAVNESDNFTDNVKEVDFSNITLLDKDSSQKLGDRTMGQMSELVSQFDVSYLYTQINYNSKPIRVTPLEYNGLIKYFTNRKEGIKAYITVDSTNGESKLIKMNEGMRYMPSAKFNENLERKLRFLYPTEIFGSINFEIDDNGKPYWIAQTLKYTAVELKREVSGVVILDPVTGEATKYDVQDVPKWVDHVYEADLIIEQVNDWGKYKNGYLNTIFSQKGVVTTTDGYNYLAMDDDIYLYTGITSVISDESNIGFILTNMRTKETNFYAIPGAEEYSAMSSAIGQVQQMNYTATFPLLINLNNRPTYLISLKDNAGLVKMYAFVDVVDYQKVVVTDASSGISKAAENYLNEIGDISESNNLSNEKEITVATIKEVIIDSNTYYYITDNDANKYKVSIKTNVDLLPFLNVGDTVQIKYEKDSDVILIKEINK